MPGREIGKVGFDHLGCVLELRFREAIGFCTSRRLAQMFELVHDEAPVTPGMEVPTIRVQHLVDQL